VPLQQRGAFADAAIVPALVCWFFEEKDGLEKGFSFQNRDWPIPFSATQHVVGEVGGENLVEPKGSNP
jgi:hypothetical protein